MGFSDPVSGPANQNVYFLSSSNVKNVFLGAYGPARSARLGWRLQLGLAIGSERFLVVVCSPRSFVVTRE